MERHEHLSAQSSLTTHGARVTDRSPDGARKLDDDDYPAELEEELTRAHRRISQLENPDGHPDSTT